jgi:hypothetical protein
VTASEGELVTMKPDTEKSSADGSPPRTGLACKELTPGRFVTVSANKHTADRSLTDAIWQIVACNEGHVLLKFLGPGQPLDPSRMRRLVPLNEHDFYDAGELATSIAPAANGPCATVVRIRE